MNDEIDQAAAEAPEVDLFGAPIEQIRERWGRPSFAKNKENQQLVAGLRAAGWSQSRIAGYIGCDEKTLRKHFSRELAAGGDFVEGEMVAVLMHRMRQGHIPSLRLLREMIEAGRAAVPPHKIEPKPEALGKKELATLAAGAPTATWSTLLQH